MKETMNLLTELGNDFENAKMNFLDIHHIKQ